MHIVINAFSARRGGGKTYLRNLLQYCPDDDNVTITLLISPKSKIKVDSGKINIPKIKFPVDNPFMRIIWEKFVLPRFLRKQNTDVFFCPGGVVPRSAIGAWKTVTMFRNMIPFDIKQRKKYPLGYMRTRNWLLSKSLLWSMENADLVIFISNFAKDVIGKISRNGIKSSVVIPHGVSSDFSGTKTGIKQKIFLEGEYMVYPSIIDVYKSQKEVVQAISILRERNIDVPPLLLVGEIYGKYGQEVRKQIEKHGLVDQVILLGPVPYLDMPALYQNAKLVIFASKSENCPNILLEALAAGCAILCSNRMPMPEFGGDAVTYFEPNEPGDLADRLDELVADNTMVNSLKQNAVLQASQYSWKRSGEKTWHALTQM